MQYSNLIWRNGQPYSEMFDDIYYSSNQDELIAGEKEFKHVFFKHNDLPQRWHNRQQFVIAELGLGSGLNCLLTIREWLKHCEICGENKTLHYIAIEKYPLSPQAITELISRYPALQPLCDEFVKNYPPAVATTHTRRMFDDRVVIHFKFLDVDEALENENLKVDAWYLDGFSPAKNADMWSQAVFKKLLQNCRDGATCSTYTAAGFVKRNLQNAGFKISKVSGYGKKREMLKGKICRAQKPLLKSLLKYIDKPWFEPPVDITTINSRSTNQNMTVIGAGIAGLSVAYAMVKRGWQVTLIDKQGEVAKGASANPAAMVYPRLSVDHDVDMEFYTSAYCCSLSALSALQKNHQALFWFSHGLQQVIGKKKLLAIIEKFQFNENYLSFVKEPSINSKGIEPVIEETSKVFAKYKKAGVVLPGVLCRALKEACAENLTIVHSDIDEITNINNKWQCIKNTHVVNENDVLVVANGTGINEIGLPMNFPVECVRGQMMILNDNIQSKNISTVINAEVYVTPSILGKHYIGGTYARNNMSSESNPDDTNALLASVNHVLPGVFSGDDYCSSWVGFRSVSKDRAPIVGAVPDEIFFKQEYADLCHGKKDKHYQAAQYLKGLYLSTAHGSHGFTSSFLSAEIIAAQINNEPMPVSKKVLDYLSPARFIVNDLKRR